MKLPGTYIITFTCLGLAFAAPGKGKSAEDRAVLMRQLEEVAAKTSILAYDKDVVKNTTVLAAQITATCECEIQHLPAIQSFILHYQDGNHLPATEFLSIEGIVVAEEDEVVGPPDDPPEPNVNETTRFIDDRQNQVTNDPAFNKLWGLRNLANDADINWPQGAAKYLADSRGGNPNGPKLLVAVIDSGVDYNHPDLKDMMWKNPGEIAGNGIDDDGNGYIDDVYGVNLLQNGGAKGDPMDYKNTQGGGHGTHCAGTMAATVNNGVGIAGVAGIAKGKVQIMAVRAIPGDFAAILEGINYAIAMGAKLSSNSWGGKARNTQPNAYIKRILDQNPDHLFVSAAGNDGEHVTEYNMPQGIVTGNHLCVAASTPRDQKAGFSNYGTPYVHVFAPGTEIYSTYPQNTYETQQGTSMACPHVSGLAALVMTIRNDLNGAQVRQLIERNVKPRSQYRGVVTTGGLIDVDATLSEIVDDGNNKPEEPEEPKEPDNPEEPETPDQPGGTCRDAWGLKTCKTFAHACDLIGYGRFSHDFCAKTCGNCNSNCRNEGFWDDKTCYKYRAYCKTDFLLRINCSKACNLC